MPPVRKEQLPAEFGAGAFDAVENEMRLGVIGAGHVGLVTAVTMAEMGHTVVATDQDNEKIETLRRGESWFYEPGLQDLLTRHLGSDHLEFVNDMEAVGTNAEVVFICVGTPPRATGEANMVAVESAATQVAPHLRGRVAIVEKSTVPAGTSKRLRRSMKHARPDMGDDLQIVSNPEFLREGKAIEDSLHPDRILVGADSDWALETMRNVYRPLIDDGHTFIATDIATAEISKHACNAFLALKISYANALARLCERAGADVVAVADVMGSDPRIGRAFLNAGIGYGGSCFPKDLAAFERLSAQLGYDFSLLGEIAKINHDAIDAAFDKIIDAVWNLEGKTITLLGLSFKPDTDDTRFSPALELARKLIASEARVVGYDPKAGSNAKSEVPELELAPDAYSAISGSHCLVLCTEWDEFRDLDFNRIKELMTYPLVIDGRNILDPEVVSQAGLSYVPVGRSPLIQEFDQ